ncbi:uncharacterized protein C2845_PM03G28860 [Panicum miliaceum]|uniref:Aminotransferase-like plant mobile domain-containing protein n=1 Tax=Panicum miliaceum TaxID=4540 RepID=A0A3L6T6C5_PANMI|nr:uncharacterized protein C2845_PM03G28860 [Panicum miliaceum]
MQKSKGKEVMDGCHIIKKQQEKDLRKKGSARRLILINSTLEDRQKKAIRRVSFGGLLLVQCWSIPEKLSYWLIKRFDVTRSELVIPYRGTIKVDDHVVHKIFGIPIGGEQIDYAKNSFTDKFEEFYKVFNHENDQKASSFMEAEKWILGKGKRRSDTLWLQYWLEFAISSLLCHTSSTTLCVRAFHAISDSEKISKYNWCRPVVERLIKGIIEFNNGERKSMSGCLLFLTIRCIIVFPFFTHMILYLDALDTGDLVGQTAEVRASVWTRSLVTQITGMDRVSDTEFGKLHILQLKAQYQRNPTHMLIQPQMIDEFVSLNMATGSITMDREDFKRAISDFSLPINEAVAMLTLQLCQGGQHPANSVSAQSGAPSTSAAAALKQSTSAAAQPSAIKDDDDDEF